MSIFIVEGGPHLITPGKSFLGPPLGVSGTPYFKPSKHNARLSKRVQMKSMGLFWWQYDAKSEGTRFFRNLGRVIAGRSQLAPRLRNQHYASIAFVFFHLFSAVMRNRDPCPSPVFYGLRIMSARSTARGPPLVAALLRWSARRIWRFQNRSQCSTGVTAAVQSCGAASLFACLLRDARRGLLCRARSPVSRTQIGVHGPRTPFSG